MQPRLHLIIGISSLILATGCLRSPHPLRPGISEGERTVLEFLKAINDRDIQIISRCFGSDIFESCMDVGSKYRKETLLNHYKAIFDNPAPINLRISKFQQNSTNSHFQFNVEGEWAGAKIRDQSWIIILEENRIVTIQQCMFHH